MALSREMGRRLLWVDGVGAAAVGLAVLVLADWLSELYRLPQEVVLFTGRVNLAYSCYSLPLAMKSRRTMTHLRILVVANFAWVPVCFGLAVAYGGEASFFGLDHLVAEGLYVGGLASLEWRARELLVQ